MSAFTGSSTCSSTSRVRTAQLFVFVAFGSWQCMAANANDYSQTNLVSDIPGLAANMDANLKNPWGVSFGATSPFWVSNQGSGTSTLYDGAGATIPLVVSIPSTGAPGPSGPTGQVFAAGGGFTLSNGSPAAFIFDTLDGQILGWNGAAKTTAISMATASGAIYTGLAEASVGSANYLYAANNAGGVDIYNTSFKNVTSTTFSGKFTDPSPLTGFHPFNVQNINGNLYVTYAANTAQGVGLPGGYVDEFDSAGNFMKRVATSGSLYAPWGVALAPSGFGAFGGDLLIGNFGNGEVLAYDPLTNTFKGTLDAPGGTPIVNDFLWALDFRTGGPNVNTDALYFTAGINGQKDGLFGEITATPEPSALALFGLALIGGAGYLRRRRTERCC